MRGHAFTEKQTHTEKSSSATGRVAICFVLQVLLCSSLYVVGSTLYLLISTRITDETVLVPGVIAPVAGTISISHVALQHTVAWLSRSAQTEPRDKFRTRTRWLATVTLRLTLTMWLVSSGLSVTFTLARHPRCSADTSVKPPLDAGIDCVIQRSVVGSSILALIVSFILFIFSVKVEDPFRSHLFGVAKEQALLPTTMPYKTSMERPMFSEMSFKCRSSTSLSSHTLVPSCDSAASLLPTNPDKTVGLGIYAPRTSHTHLLGPRPSLASIRTRTTISTLPPSSPLPPLPAYFPEKYRQGSAMHKAIYPPRRPPRTDRSQSENTVRLVPPSPALSVENLQMHNNSIESLSSVYSRSISGERRSSGQNGRPTMLTNSSRSYSSGSTATIVKSPLSSMRLADHPDVLVEDERSRESIDSYNTEIDDAVTLQAKLPSVKAVSEFGDVLTWANFDKSLIKTPPHDQGPYSEQFKRKTWKALVVRRTRNTGSLFQCSNTKPLV